jgi:hypothetical protein
LPRLITARDQARQLHATAAASGPIPPLQQQAITAHMGELDQLIAELEPAETAVEEER